jgi:hypothetical protein
MLGLAHSGATINIHEQSVSKVGDKVVDQAEYLKLLPSSVSPGLLATWAHGYAMERLEELDLFNKDNIRSFLLQAKWVLVDYFWSQPAPVNHDPDWITRLEGWAVDYPWLKGMVYSLYEYYPPGKMTMIHGDPTLANCMHRNHSLVFIDPLRPTGKIPSYPEVDLGKLLQSALGWEHVLTSAKNGPDKTVPMPWFGMAAELLNGCSALEYNRAWFWCAIHCARLVPYTSGPTTRHWGIHTSQEAIGAVRL